MFITVDLFLLNFVVQELYFDLYPHDNLILNKFPTFHT